MEKVYVMKCSSCYHLLPLEEFDSKYINCKKKNNDGFDQLKYVLNEIKNNPEFSEVFKHFPDAKIISIEDKN